jgi:hypothetical protein
MSDFRVINPRRVNKGAVVWTFDVEDTRTGTVMQGVALLARDGRRWLSPPSDDVFSEQLHLHLLPLAEAALRDA